MSQIMQLKDAKSVNAMSQFSSGIRSSKQFGKSIKAVSCISKGFNGTFWQFTQQRPGRKPAIMIPKAMVTSEVYTGSEQASAFSVGGLEQIASVYDVAVAAADEVSDSAPALQDAVDAIQIPELMSDSVAALENVSESATAALEDLTSGLGSSVDSVAAGASGLTSSLSSSADSVAAGVSGLTSSLSSSADSVAAGVSGLTGGLTSSLSSSADSVAAGVSGLTSTLSSSVGSVAAGVSGLAGGVTSTASSALQQVGSAVQGGIDTVTGAVGGASSAVSAATAGLTSQVGGVLAGVGSAVVGVEEGVAASAQQVISVLPPEAQESLRWVASAGGVALGWVGQNPLIAVAVTGAVTVPLVIKSFGDKYGGYSGEISPLQLREMMLEQDVLLVDIRPESLRAEQGLPELKLAARLKATTFAPNEIGLPGSVVPVVKDPSALRLQVAATYLTGLRGIKDALTPVVIMDERGGKEAVALARALRIVGQYDAYILGGGFQRWIADDMPVETGPTEYDGNVVKVLGDQVEVFVQSSVEQLSEPGVLLSLGLATGVGGVALYNYHLTLQYIAVLGSIFLVYQKISSLGGPAGVLEALSTLPSKVQSSMAKPEKKEASKKAVVLPPPKSSKKPSKAAVPVPPPVVESADVPIAEAVAAAASVIITPPPTAIITPPPPPPAVIITPPPPPPSPSAESAETASSSKAAVDSEQLPAESKPVTEAASEEKAEEGADAEQLLNGNGKHEIQSGKVETAVEDEMSPVQMVEVDS